jgi:arylsulfatase A-like enzyme
LEAIQCLFFSSLYGQIPWQLRWLGVSIEILWIAPIFNLLLFLLVAATVVVLGAFYRKAPSKLILMILLCFLSAHGLLSLTGLLHEGSVWVLSLGLTTVTYRLPKKQSISAELFMRKSLPYLAGVVLFLALMTTIGKDLQEQVRADNLPPAAANAPNVLLIVLDTLRADHLTVYGYKRPTSPNIDRLAHQGVLFENAYSNSSWTVPSHASMLTGKLAAAHGAGVRFPLDDDFKTLAEELAGRGYVTGGFVANTYWAGSRSGFDQGFLHFEDYFGSITDMASRTVYGRKLASLLLPMLGDRDMPGRKMASDINDSFLEWLQDKGERPFFCFLNYMDVHDPYLPPPEYRNRFSNKVNDGQYVNFIYNKFFVSRTLSPEETQLVIDAYDSSLSYLDTEIGSLMAALEKQGILDNTLVIITSDHGEAFGEHGVFAHSNGLYREQIHIPLILRYPEKIRAGQRVRPAVGLRGIPATVIDLLEGKDSSAFPDPGLTNLLDGVTGEEAASTPGVVSELSRVENAPDTWHNSKGWLKSIVNSRWHLILHESGRVELYDVQNDPRETLDLANTPSGKEVAREMEAELRYRISSQQQGARNQ